MQFIAYCHQLIHQYRSLSQDRRAEKLLTSVRSFQRFLPTTDVAFSRLTSELILRFDVSLKQQGLSANTRSFYLRTLRAAYNHAVAEGHVVQRFPFRQAYTGIAPTIKRALSFRDLHRLQDLDLSDRPKHAFARDVFILSFLLRGMPFVDMAYLRKTDLSQGILIYHRQKTGQPLVIGWEGCMQQLVNQLWSLRGLDPQSSPYLLPLIDTETDPRRQYLRATQRINGRLHALGEELGFTLPLTTYVARHSWASIAHSRAIPLSVISESLGHNSERTTRIYLASLNNQILDAANRKVFKGLF